MKAPRGVIAIDIDGVLSDPRPTHPVPTSRPPFASLDTLLNVRHSRSPRAHATLLNNSKISRHYAPDPRNPIAGAAEAMSRLRSLGYRIHLVTARPTSAGATTVGWLNHNGFKGLWDAIHFVTKARYTGRSVVYDMTPKIEILRRINAKIFIDDDLRNIIPCSNSGVHCILFDATRPTAWNRPASTITMRTVSSYSIAASVLMEPNVVTLGAWDAVIKWMETRGYA